MLTMRTMVTMTLLTLLYGAEAGQPDTTVCPTNMGNGFYVVLATSQVGLRFSQYGAACAQHGLQPANLTLAQVPTVAEVLVQACLTESLGPVMFVGGIAGVPSPYDCWVLTLFEGNYVDAAPAYCYDQLALPAALCQLPLVPIVLTTQTTALSRRTLTKTTTTLTTTTTSVSSTTQYEVDPVVQTLTITTSVTELCPTTPPSPRPDFCDAYCCQRSQTHQHRMDEWAGPCQCSQRTCPGKPRRQARRNPQDHLQSQVPNRRNSHRHGKSNGRGLRRRIMNVEKSVQGADLAVTVCGEGQFGQYAVVQGVGLTTYQSADLCAAAGLHMANLTTASFFDAWANLLGPCLNGTEYVTGIGGWYGIVSGSAIDGACWGTTFDTQDLRLYYAPNSCPGFLAAVCQGDPLVLDTTSLPTGPFQTETITVSTTTLSHTRTITLTLTDVLGTVTLQSNSIIIIDYLTTTQTTLTETVTLENDTCNQTSTTAYYTTVTCTRSRCRDHHPKARQ
jgi:hypothetical protein